MWFVVLRCAVLCHCGMMLDPIDLTVCLFLSQCVFLNLFA